MEDRQMQTEIVKHLQDASPEDILKFTGINNWEHKSQSYTKILYNNTLLPYDKQSIYCMDKLHITLKSQESKKKIDYRSLFRSKQQYDVNKWITIIPDNRRQSNYYYSFSIVVEGNHFGKINFFHTRRNRNCLLEIDNEVLYCQKVSWIIAGVFVTAKAFDLYFNNFFIAEVARDSTDNIYDRLTDIYYQSVHCSKKIHILYENREYYKSVTKCKFSDTPDESDTIDGIFRIGKSTSNVFQKTYNKSKEIKDKGNRKQYIDQLYESHFDSNEDVYRIEMTANSGAFEEGGIFGKEEIDLLYLLNKNHLPTIFFRLLGDRLVFKDLRTKRWVNGNAVYDTVSILEPPPSFTFDEIPPKTTIRKYTHDKNINHAKLMINQYLDRKIGYGSLVDFTIRGMRENVNFALDFRLAYKKVQGNHKNKIQMKQHRKLERLCSILGEKVKPNSGLKVLKLMTLFL